MCFFFFFFNDTATTEIYTLSLHDALPICIAAQQSLSAAQLVNQIPQRVRDFKPSLPAPVAGQSVQPSRAVSAAVLPVGSQRSWFVNTESRSEEHTSELQSQSNLVCRLLLE